MADEDGGSSVLTSVIPVNIRKFVSHLVGNKSPITEADFSQKDIQRLRESVRRKISQSGTPSGEIGYGDYGDSPHTYDFAMGQSGPVDMLVGSYTSPAFRLDTTLGMARYVVDENDDVIIEDRYNFNANREKINRILEDKGKFGTLLYAFKMNGYPGVLNAIGNIIGSTDDEEGTPVRINLGPLNKRED